MDNAIRPARSKCAKTLKTVKCMISVIPNALLSFLECQLFENEPDPALFTSFLSSDIKKNTKIS
jgi:hypothetical protein